MEKSFESEYSKLNNEQKLAVDTVEGPVMVIAGPGTGKTQILTLRIANILKQTDTEPNNILALTFTESAASNMRKRLVSLIGTPGYFVRISTFHGFANSLIQDYPDYFSELLNSVSAGDIDRAEIVRALLDSLPLEKLRPKTETYYYLRDILSSIRSLKTEGISTHDFAKTLKDWRKSFESDESRFHEKGAYAGKLKSASEKELIQIEKNEELCTIYEAYEAALRERKLYDFEDMLLVAHSAMLAEFSLLSELRETYQYILVDEHQDTNGAQNKLLEILVGDDDSPNLFIVGDEKQAIFRFQGANLDNFLYFQKKFKNARKIELRENYRSTQTILDSSQSLIEKNKAVLSGSLRSQHKLPGAPISITETKTSDDEISFLVEEIKKELKQGVPPEEIAVLYRDNKDALPIVRALEKTDIPFIVYSDENLLKDQEIKKIILLLNTIEKLGNDELLAECLHIDFFDIDPLDIAILLNTAASRHLPLIVVARNPERFAENALVSPEKISKVMELLTRLKRQSKNTDFLRFVESLLKESGALESALKTDEAEHRLGRLNAFYDTLKSLTASKPDYSLSDFVEQVEILRAHDIPLKNKSPRLENAIRLMTAHKAKGLEFKTVFITGAYDGHWGGRREFGSLKLTQKSEVKASDLEREEDERRLFYVAITRAKERVYISYPAKAEDGRDRVPSIFISELKPEITERSVFVSDKKNTGIFTSEEAPKKSESETRKKLQDYVKGLLEKRGLSATALNKYLKCPWSWYYETLLRIPKAKAVSQMYGTAVHGALKDFFDKKKTSPETPLAFLTESFLFHLKKETNRTKDFEHIKTKGLPALQKYGEYYENKWTYNTLTEYAVNGIELAPGVKITGKLDKLELTKNSSNVSVVDYKTKKPESRNWIQGKTANSDGGYYRQLVFYKLLLDNLPKKPYNMISGVLDFVEPNERGLFKQEVFEIEESEVKDLKELVIQTYHEIQELGFYDKRCEDRDCSYCALRSKGD